MHNIDLHNHSHVSDGLLSPTELVGLAAANGVTVLALTDHDDLEGLTEAAQAATRQGLVLVPGVEISVTWCQRTIHVVGLQVDPSNSVLRAGLEILRSGRMARAERMAGDLARAGIPGALEGALRHAHNPRIIARPHFARFLVEQGHARTVQAVFKRFLVKGKTGYVRHEWARLEQAVAWIHGAGGMAVLAHPGRYGVSAHGLQELLNAFVQAGGNALEVVTSNHDQAQTDFFAAQSHRLGLSASRGSDYHGPGESRFEPGKLPPLPVLCTPVWQNWSLGVGLASRH